MVPILPEPVDNWPENKSKLGQRAKFYKDLTFFVGYFMIYFVLVFLSEN